MKAIVSSIETKRVHRCPNCWGVGGWKGVENGFIHEQCGFFISKEDWEYKTYVVEVPVWTATFEEYCKFRRENPQLFRYEDFEQGEHKNE